MRRREAHRGPPTLGPPAGSNASCQASALKAIFATYDALDLHAEAPADPVKGCHVATDTVDYVLTIGTLVNHEVGMRAQLWIDITWHI